MGSLAPLPADADPSQGSSHECPETIMRRALSASSLSVPRAAVPTTPREMTYGPANRQRSSLHVGVAYRSRSRD